MIYTLVATAIVSAALAAGSAWQIQDWRLGAKIATLKKGQSDNAALQAQGALDDLAAAAKTINQAAAAARVDNTHLAAQLGAIRKELKNAKPLPADCKPDPERLRSLTAAVDATNQAAARPVPGR